MTSLKYLIHGRQRGGRRVAQTGGLNQQPSARFSQLWPGTCPQAQPQACPSGSEAAPSKSWISLPCHARPWPHTQLPKPGPARCQEPGSRTLVAVGASRHPVAGRNEKWTLGAKGSRRAGDSGKGLAPGRVGP